MRTLAGVASLLALTAGMAQAGGLDRSRLSYGILFEPGNYVELGITQVSPDVAGAYPAILGGGSTGDMAGAFTGVSFAYKHQFTDRLAVGLFVNSAYSADADYTSGPYAGVGLGGLSAKWKSSQVAAIAKYRFNDAVSVYGGLRYLRSSAEIYIPQPLFTAPGGYAAVGDSDGQVGYIIGAAYERPDIALRVGLTYESGFTHEFRTTETTVALPLTGRPNPFVSTTEVEMPQSIALDFQSGIAKDTLLFGSIRWSEWSVWNVAPEGYDALVDPANAGTEITGFDNDVITWTLGLGRRLNENWSVFARASYEKANGGVASRLSPTDGSRSFGIGGTYTRDNVKITAGVEYVKLGDAVDGSGVRFSGNSALGVGVNVGFSF